MTTVTFALPQESGDFRRALRAGGGKLGGEKVEVVHLGIGPEAARRNGARLLAGHQPGMLICAGFAGGLDARLTVGDLILAENFSTPELRARAEDLDWAGVPRFVGSLATRDVPAETPAAKRLLARETGALAVDMETAPIFELCREAGVPILALRAISDAADSALPLPFDVWFDLPRQRPRRWRLLASLLRHPECVAPFAHFVRSLAPARRSLAEFLVRFLSAGA